jgi:hypothetical protein
MAQGNTHGQRDNGQKQSSYDDRGTVSDPISTSVELTDTQKEDLSYIIEEEKVARDVYLTLYTTWENYVFKNIASSEQKHIDALVGLFSSYGVETPLTLEEVGIFENAELQKLYDDLIERGNDSLLDALEVGVVIEETDIADLENLLESGVPSDFERVYNNLLNGSNKHLDAFNNEISKQ